MFFNIASRFFDRPSALEIRVLRAELARHIKAVAYVADLAGDDWPGYGSETYRLQSFVKELRATNDHLTDDYVKLDERYRNRIDDDTTEINRLLGEVTRLNAEADQLREIKNKFEHEADSRKNQVEAHRKVQNAYFNETQELRIRVGELELDNDRLLKIIADPKLLDIALEEGALSIKMQPNFAVIAMARSFEECLGEAPNYRMVHLEWPAEQGGAFRVTVTRPGGSDPAETVVKLQGIVKELIEVSFLRVDFDAYAEWLKTDPGPECLADSPISVRDIDLLARAEALLYSEPKPA